MQEACNTIRVHDQKSSTAPAAYLLCRMGYISDVRIQKTFWRLLETHIPIAAGAAISFSLGTARKQNIQMPGLRLLS